MAILIKCERATGQVALSSKLLEGNHTPERTYDIVDGFVSVDGDPIVVNHDANEILAMDGFSLASPAEQEAATSTKRKAKSVKE